MGDNNKDLVQEINQQRHKNGINYIILITTLIVVIGLASTITEFDYYKAFIGIPGAIKWLISNFVPNKESLKYIPNIFEKTIMTVIVSITAATLASIIAYIMAIIGADVTKTNASLSAFVSMIASFFRNIPDIVWSMIFLFSFGQNIFTGFVAIFFVNIGNLTRAFIEVIDQTSIDGVEALKATGARLPQIINQGIIPDSIAGIISWTLYYIENNIRSSTLIGVLTGTGIGQLFNLYYKSFNYQACSLVVISISIIVLLVQLITNILRRIII